MANTASPAVITYGDHEIDPATLPASSINALLRRGIAHYLGNEVASKVSGEVTKLGTAAAAALGDDADEAARDEARKHAVAGVTDSQRAEWKATHVATALQAMTSGTMGEGAARGPRKDPFEAACEAIAKAQVQAVLKSAGLREPKGDKVVNLQGTDFTMAELVSRRLANEKYRPGIEKEAKRRLREIEAATKARDAVEAGAEPSIDDLGL